MNERSPLITVLIPVYNEARHIAQTLDSVQGQTYRPLEILVIDDGSTDGTREIVLRYPEIALLQQRHLGKARAVNAGAGQARGELLFFIDGDLVLDPDYVEKLAEPILQGRCLGTCHTEERVANPDNPWSRCLQARSGLPPERRLEITAQEMEAGSTVYRAVGRERFLSVGGFDDTGHSDDQTLWGKLGQRALFVPGTGCSHYNPETMGEVFSAGVWGGKTILLGRGPRSLLSFSPPLVALRALRRALTSRGLRMGTYTLVSETGVFWGIAKRTLGFDRTHGK